MKLKIIPFYTRCETLSEALEDGRSKKLLWLEIIFNDSVAWEEMEYFEIKEAYEKASLWYSNFKSLIDSYIKRKPLPYYKGKPDFREYRRFLEVINFVSR